MKNLQQKTYYNFEGIEEPPPAQHHQAVVVVPKSLQVAGDMILYTEKPKGAT